MSVSNGQLANATTFNNAFMSRTADDNTIGIKSLENADAPSGDNVDNLQESINSLSNYSGRVANDPITALPAWVNNDVGTGTDNLTERADALTERFNDTTGHIHDGTTGNAPQISVLDVTDINQFRADWQTVDITTTAGTSTDVSIYFSGKTPGGNVSTAGVVTTGGLNRIVLVDSSTETAIEDTEGQRVYGRLTWAASVWTLSFFTNEAGVETAYSIGVAGLRIYFREVYTLATFPTIGADMGQIPSLDLTADIVDAGPNQRGLTRFAAGSEAIANAADTVSVTFSTAFPDTNYAIATTMRNTTDPTPQVYLLMVTAKSTTGFTAQFNSAMDSANYFLEYTATRNQ